MTMHKRTRLTPLDREEIWRLHGTRQWTVVALAQQFRVSRPTIYKVLEWARKQEFAPRKSYNTRFFQAPTTGSSAWQGENGPRTPAKPGGAAL